eukprot:CAMPEP_0202731464 /NCGR_PEP_ID=MMETSP1385-20130828/187166_1 /ASSEMBLY_ACC=CAM_ASM_000861 /TAXON_ID=933848 /ORGANISM="Elphidium margaritaceum" /LENGTH=228 /DNA_ID=CAMNT_0049397765 /DNA_START=2597 /DNA_END=3283 /DNA_ORIENTATION=+
MTSTPNGFPPQSQHSQPINMYNPMVSSHPNLLHNYSQPINMYPAAVAAAAPNYPLELLEPLDDEMDSASQKQVFLSPEQCGSLQARQTMDASLVQLLEQGTIMTKFPSIHTETANYMQALSRMKGKYKLLRMAPDWQTLEFHNILCANGGAQQQPQISLHATKPPKVLPVANMRCVESVFAGNCKDLYIYALDKNGKEIAIKLICETFNDTKRWTMALTQIIARYKSS